MTLSDHTIRLKQDTSSPEQLVSQSFNKRGLEKSVQAQTVSKRTTQSCSIWGLQALTETVSLCSVIVIIF